MTATPEQAAAQYPIGSLTGPPIPQPGGHIHRNWTLTTVHGRYFLQRLNTLVFRDIELLQRNAERIGHHLRSRGLTSPTILRTEDGRSWWQGADGSAWRLFDYLERRRTAGAAEAAAVGAAFGRFAAALADLPGPPLEPTLPGFHDLRARWEAFRTAEAAGPAGRVAASGRERAAVCDHLDLADALAGLPVSIAHGDAKAANVLLDPAGALDPVVVDLDTAGPAPLIIDSGDLIRSCSVRAAEDEADLDRVVLDDELLCAVIGGWLNALPEPPDPAAIIRSGQAICWEQAVRFLTDYLDGDRYYPVNRPDHNLVRARTQLRILEQLLDRADQLVAAVARLAPGGR